MQGVVKFFNGKRGYGYIAADGGGDIPVHYSGIAAGQTLHEGDRVSYDNEAGNGSAEAINVKVVQKKSMEQIIEERLKKYAKH